MEINLPKNSTGGGDTGNSSYIVPKGLDVDSSNIIYADILNKIVKKEDELQDRIAAAEEKIGEYKKEVEKQGFKSIEIIGIFSAVLALVLIDVSIIKTATTFLAAILMIASLAVVMAIFALIIHLLFAPEDRYKLRWWTVWLPILVLISFIILAVVAQHYNWPWAVWSVNIPTATS